MAAAGAGAAAAGTEDITLDSAPTDGITRVAFSPTSAPLLLATSWDTSARVYDVATNTLKATLPTAAPLLDGCWVDDHSVAAGGLDKTVRIFDMEASTATVVAHHEAPVRAIEYSAEHSAIITGSWDKTVALWDVRSPKDKAKATLAAPERVYAMTQCGAFLLIVATAGRHIHLHDLRKAGGAAGESVVYARESSLKHQTRAIRAFVNGAGYVTASIEGRCAVDYVDPADQASKKYAFKCHRTNMPGTTEDRVFPVNALTFHPVFGTLVTGGADGVVYSWDHLAKKRLATVKNAPTSIASVSYNRDGTQLAIAASYTFEQGERERPADSIIIHKVTDKEANVSAKK